MAMHPPCSVCYKRFEGLEELQSHQKQTLHLYCCECGLHFSKTTIHIEHVRKVRHAVQYHCCDCDRDYNSQQTLNNHCCDCDKVFRSRKSLDRHFAKKSHLLRVDKVFLHNCKKCTEKFPTKRALQKHKLKHRPLRHIPCPVSIACQKKFAAPSGLLSHLESGRCHSGMTREKMHQLVLAQDQNHHITNVEATGVASSVAQNSSWYFPL
jgi:hypothetical protein